jgi:hypothetical protein
MSHEVKFAVTESLLAGWGPDRSDITYDLSAGRIAT